MAIKTNALLAACLSTFLLLATACNQTAAPATPTPQQVAELEANARAAQAGNGFVCDGGTSTYTCFCKKGSVGNFSCNGMEQMCRATGAKVICKPDGWCHCGGLYAQH